MDYAEALDHLDSLINYEVTPRAGAVKGLRLEPMREFMAALGDPQTTAPVIHITGTNGKGSTARMIEAIFTTMGLRVGLYSSPHLSSPRERIRLGGQPIDEDMFADAIESVVRVEDVQGLGPRTWFDTVTSAGLLVFANEAVDVAVVEVGMLGRFDSTNVVEADVAVITNVDLDHTDGGDGWRQQVAEEKAGIVTPGRPVVLGENDAALRGVVERERPSSIVALGTEFELGANRLAVGGRLLDLRTPRAVHDDLFVPLHGAHQGANAAVAVAATEEFFDAAVPPDVLAEAFDGVTVPGRLEVVHHDPLVIVDAAHNVPGTAALARAVDETFGSSARRFLVVGMQDGRDPVAVLRALAVTGYELVVTCTAPTGRGLAAEDLAAAARGLGARADAVHDPAAALDEVAALAAPDDLVVVAGSITVVGPAREIIDRW